MLNRHFSPARYERPDEALIASYAAEWAGSTDEEIASNAADTYSALSGWGTDEESAACSIALLNEVDRRGLRGAVADILDSRD